MNLTLWLEADSSFFLIVQKRRGEYQVRAHLRQSLENLCRIADLNAEIEESPQSAMRFRILLSAPEVFRMLARLDHCEPDRPESPKCDAARPDTNRREGISLGIDRPQPERPLVRAPARYERAREEPAACYI